MNNENSLYDIKTIMDLIEEQFIQIMRNDYEFYKDYDIKLANEQYYVKPEDRKTPNKIYIVVKFLPGDINYNQNIIPITITAVSEYNKLNVCQKLLLEYAQVFNLVSDVSDNNINYNQTYTTPQTISNFSEVYFGYRDVFLMSGTFLLSYNTNSSSLTYVYTENEKEIEEQVDAITFNDDLTVSLDTQPFFNTHNFTQSVGKYMTYTIHFGMYLVKNNLCNKILQIIAGEEDIDYTFKFKIDYKDGFSYTKNFKLAGYSRSQDIGAMPVISCTFTN